MASPPIPNTEICVLNYFDPLEQIEEIYIANGWHLADDPVEDVIVAADEESIPMDDDTVLEPNYFSFSEDAAETEEFIIPGLDEATIDAQFEPIIIESQEHLSNLNLNSNACGICLEDYLNGDAIGRINCLHWFHEACIKPWLRNSNSCPLCREMALNV